MTQDERPGADPSDLLARWVGVGLLTVDQADRIAAWEAGAPAQGCSGAPGPPGPVALPGQAHVPPRAAMLPRAGMSPVIEALVYLGGAIVLAAVGIVVGTYWNEMTFAGRVAVPAAAMAVLTGGGAAVPASLGALGVRLRSALWLAAAGALLLLLIVLTGRATDAGRLDGPTALLIVAGVLLAGSGLLWLWHRTGVQQLATFVAVELLAVALVQLADTGFAGEFGAAMVVVAAAWGLLSAIGALPGGGRWLPAAGSAVAPGGGEPRDGVSHLAGPARANDAESAAQRRWGIGLAAAGALVGSILMAAQWQHPWLGLLPVAAAVIAGVALSDLLVLIVGAAGTLIVLPMVVDRYVHSTVLLALLLLVVGAAMVTLALVVARRRGRMRPVR